MSSTESTAELKGGHPPAVKAGGMRITQHKVQTHEKPIDIKKTDIDEEEEEVAASPSSTCTAVKPSAFPPKQHLMISGALARGDADFPTEAVQAFHNKPIPAHDYRPVTNKPTMIHQPRK